ncbi:MAG: UrcA family protein [Erythrobacter sp.]
MNLNAFIPAALGLVLAATPALAQLPDQRPDQRIMALSISDLDLATPQGQKELNSRIDRAIRDVCQTSRKATGTRLMSEETRTCIAKARASARAQVAAAMAQQSQQGG